MDRLTEETQLGPFASLKDKAEARPGAFHDYDCLYAHMVAVTRLKAYEDTGLSPADIATLTARAETAEAERDAAVEDLKQDRHCTLCKHHMSEGGDCYGVSKCAVKGIRVGWEWRGQQAGEGDNLWE